MPDTFFRGVVAEPLPPPGQYGIAVRFLPHDDERRRELEQLLVDTVEAEGQRVVRRRDVDVDTDTSDASPAPRGRTREHLVVAAAPELAEDQWGFER